MVTKEEYLEKVAEIEQRFEVGKAVDGLSVLNLYIRTDSKGQTYLIGKTHQSAMPLFSVKVDAGLPEVLIKEDAERQLSLQHREKLLLQEKIKQEAIQEEVRRRQAEIQKAAAEKQNEIAKEADKKISSKLKKLFGG